LSARRALLATASASKNVNSAAERLIVTTSGAENTTTVGNLEFQRNPGPAISEDLRVTTAGKSTHIKAVLTGTAFYLSEPALATRFGKPWLKIDLSALKGAGLASIAQLVNGLKSNNLLDQTQLLAVAKHLRVVGKATVNGVATTEYAGSLRADQALSTLSPAARKALAPAFRLLGNTLISFRIWIDGQHFTRKVTEVETVNGDTIHTTVITTAINQPVQITAPPASLTVSPPGM